MARTIFVTQTYVNNKISTETSQRVVADTAIENIISTQSTKIANNTSTIATVNNAITLETSQRQAQIGNMAFHASLVNENLTAVTNLTEAVNAVTRSRLAVEAQIGSLNVESVLALQTTVNALQTKVNSDSQKITNILAGSSIDYDTFAEIVALITTKDAETAADLDVIRTTLEALIATKMSKVQTSNTALEYVEANDASKKYKIVIVDGQLAVEDITPAG